MSTSGKTTEKKPVYTPKEFALRCERRGLTNSIRTAKEFVKEYMKETGKKRFSEEDFYEAYHALNSEPIGRRVAGYCADGEYHDDWHEMFDIDW